ncbi:MAG: tetratricopeptide repeat protein [Bacteroidales bacterium]
MKKRMSFITAFLMVVLIAAQGQTGKKYFKAGSEFMDNMKYEEAVVQFTNAITAEPANPDYYLARGEAYEKMGKNKEAYADFEKTIVFSPKDIGAHISLARVCNNLKLYDQALVLLNRASGIDKRSYQIYPEKVKTLNGLGKYDQALKVSDTAILIKDESMNYYWRGLTYVRLNNDILGKKEFERAISKNKKLVEPRLALADLLIRNNNPAEAMDQINTILEADDKNAQAYLIRSQIYKKNLDITNAINDLSKTILIDPSNPDYYLIRGKYYQDFNQHGNAIPDFTKYISLRPDDPNGFYARAKSYEEAGNIEKSIEDYNKITVLSEFDPLARKLLKGAQDRLYELNREQDAPELLISSPQVSKGNVLQIRGDATNITISGQIKEKSLISELLVNGQKVFFSEKKNGVSDFITNVDLRNTDKVAIAAKDEYNNTRNINLDIVRTEINPPKIKIVAPYTSDDGMVILDAMTPRLVIEGKIEDESEIKTIQVGGKYGSWDPRQLNPNFTVDFDIANLNKFTVLVEDIYGNKQETEYTINRDNAQLLASNPMGKTWVVFIENSSYETFASLDGPIKDVTTIQRALSGYQVANFIHKKDMTKLEMERYFNIELRDQLKANQVKSLLVWYAGHGKFINDIGYWIPVDAKRDEEFTYFSINTLKAGMQSYTGLSHTLVVTDACESGPSFYQAMRAVTEEPTCDNYMKVAKKSAQVFSSAGTELAVDKSQFTQTFANTLINNKNACIPIETLVNSVKAAVKNSNQQTPKFGKIAGLEDEDGTFFFIAK